MAFHTSTPIKKLDSNTSASTSNLDDTFDRTQKGNDDVDSLIDSLCNDIENIDVDDQSTSYACTSSDDEEYDSKEEIDEGKKKWDTLEYNGPLFPPPYEKLPENVKLIYNNQEINLSETAEEIATFFAKKIINKKIHTTNAIFKQNFFKDWRENMDEKERNIITNLDLCDFSKICDYFKTKEELNISFYKGKNLSKHGYCVIDNKKEEISNFMVDVPGFYDGHGKHKFFGRIKKRITPEQVKINCSKNKIPSPPEGHNWKEVCENKTVLWLAEWTDETKNKVRQIRLKRNALKTQENVQEKYEITRKLGHILGKIENDYKTDWKSNKMEERQRGVVLYFLNKLALRIGNTNISKADTVGCCSLLVKHITLEDDNVMTIDCYTKNFKRYYKSVQIQPLVYKNIKKFMKDKTPEKKLFDEITPQKINIFLKKYEVEGLTSRFFRLYRSSKLLENKLKQLTNPEDNEEDKLVSFSIALDSVAALCNHQVVSQKKKQIILEKEKLLAEIDSKFKNSTGNTTYLEAQRKELAKQIGQLKHFEENNVFNVSTTKNNYVDPRIIVAWCIKNNIPFKKVLPEDEFDWAIKEFDFVF